MVLAILFIIISIIVFYVIHQCNYWKAKGVKYVTPLPIFGNYFSVLIGKQSRTEKMVELYNKHPSERYSGIFRFMKPALLIRDLDLIKEILIKKFDHFENHPQITWPSVDTTLNNFLTYSKGEKWRNSRKLLNPYFGSNNNLKLLFEVIDRNMKSFISRDLLIKFEENCNNDVVMKLAITEVGAKFTSRIMSELCFGNEHSAESDELFYRKGLELTNISGRNLLKAIIYPLFPEVVSRFFNLKIFPDSLSNFFKSTVRKILMNQNKNVEDDPSKLINRYVNKLKLYDSIEFDDVQITGQMMSLFFASYDPASVLIAFSLYELAVNPDIQQKLRSEVDEILTEFSFDTVTSAKYLDMFLCELLRKYGGTEIDRVCTKTFEIQSKDTNETALRINVGDIIVVPHFAILRDPKYFPDPDIFDPERFSGDNVKNVIATGAYNPFGLGPRACVAGKFGVIQCKVFLVRLLGDFEVVAVDKTYVPLKESKNNYLYAPVYDLSVGLKCRRPLLVTVNNISDEK